MNNIPHILEKRIILNIENVLKIFKIDNTFNFITNESILYTLHTDLSICNSISTIKPKHTYNSKKNKDFVSFSSSHYAILIENTIRVYTLKNVLTYEINLQDLNLKDVSSIYLTLDNNLLIGFETGKIIYHFNDKKTFIYLPKLRDYIETIYETETHIIYGSYNGMVNILDKQSFEIYMSLELSKYPILTIFSINEYKILIQDRSGKVFIVDLISKMAKYITTITNTIIYVSTYNKNICVINTNAYETFYISHFFESHFKITQSNDSTLIDNENTIIRLSNESALIYKDVDEYINETINDKKNLLLEDTLYNLYNIIETNIFVKKKSEYYVIIDSIFELFALKAIDILNNNTPEFQNKKKLLIDKLLNPFRKIKKYDLSLVELKQYSNAFKNFITMYKGENYYMCYELANQYSFLKSTNEYKNLENKFKILFYEIYKNVNHAENYQKLQLRMKPYNLVKEKKKYIEYLNNKHVVLDMFFKSIELKNFKIYFNLLEKNQDFLSEQEPFKEYNSIMNNEITKLYKLTECVENIEATSKAITILKDSKEYKEEMEIKSIWIKDYQNFIDLYKTNKIYLNSNNNKYIQNSVEFKKLKNKFSQMYKIIQETPKIVLKSYILEKFKPFLEIYEEEIKELIKFQYIKMIYHMIKSNHKNVENIVSSYINICGKDYHIQNIIDEYDLKTFSNIDKSLDNHNIDITKMPDQFNLKV